MDQVVNFAYTTVSVAPSPATTGKTFSVINVGLPVTPFNAVVWPEGEKPLSTNAEVVRVEHNSAGVLEVKRLQEGSSVRTVKVGDQFMAGVTAKSFEDLWHIISAGEGGTSGVTGYVGPLIGFAVSKEGLEEPEFLERIEEYGDSCVPETELKQGKTYGGTTNPGKPNLSAFNAIYKQIGPKKRWRGHTLIWHNELAKWVETFGGTEEEFRKQILLYIEQVVSEVGNKVDCWDVINEVIEGNKLRKTKYTEMFGGSLAIEASNPVVKFYAECFKVAHAANPTVALFANEFEVESAFNYTAGQKGTAFLELVNALISLGAPISGVGFQYHTNTKRTVKISEFLAITPKFTEKELQVEITEFDCQIEPGDTEETQALKYEEAIQAAKKAGVGRFTIWGVTDKRSWLNAIWENPNKLTGTTAIAGTVFNLTESKKLKYENGVAVRFKALTGAVTTPALATTYFVKNATEGTFELSLTEGGAAIAVAGHTVEAASTEIFKWAGEGFGPRGTAFSWKGTPKESWRSAERSRPESPGVGRWISLVPNLNAKAKAKVGKPLPRARTEQLNIRLMGQIEATEELATSATIVTLPSEVKPTEEREVPWIINGVVSFLTIATNGAITINEKLPATKVLRLDGLTFSI